MTIISDYGASRIANALKEIGNALLQMAIAQQKDAETRRMEVEHQICKDERERLV